MASIAAGGWGLFLGENVILSENRTWIIEKYGDDMYHRVYNSLSTISCVSIGYAFWKHRNAATVLRPLPRVGALVQGAGLLLLSQAVPALRSPLQPAVASSGEQESRPSEAKRNRCPLDFDSYKAEKDSYAGIQRVTRHPGLWTLALVGIGRALMRPTPVHLVALGVGPMAVALGLGSHKDSRSRRQIGGNLTEEDDRNTSLVPFCAMEPLGPQKWEHVLEEFKQINGSIALGLTLAVLLRRPI